MTRSAEMSHGCRRVTFELSVCAKGRGIVVTSKRGAASLGKVTRKLATLRDLEERARQAFVWDPASGDSVAVRLMLIRASIEEKATP
jgi:hypothetical protein